MSNPRRYFLFLLLFTTTLDGRDWTDKETYRVFDGKLLGLDQGRFKIERSSDKRLFLLEPYQLIDKDVDYALVLLSDFKLSVPNYYEDWSRIWWKTKSPDQWISEYNRILKVLESVWKNSKYKHASSFNEFYKWVDHLSWMRFFFSIEKSFGEDPLFLDVFKEMGQLPELVRIFLNALNSKDNFNQAFRVLTELYKHNKEGVIQYPKLAVALAIVFDQPFPKNWPHHQVNSNAMPQPHSTHIENFDYYLNKEKEQDLHFSLLKLGVMEIKHLIDHKLPTSELEWAQKNVKHKISKFDDVFSSIQYDWSRLELGVFNWPYEDYRLETIMDNGGICVDQAYYASIAGKAKGIPTLYFSGQGANGGHAWFGFLRNEGRWITDCGQYESQNYPIGEALDPQTWETINDRELKQMSDSLGSEQEFKKSKQILDWASHISNQDTYIEVVREVRNNYSDYVEPWKMEAEFLSKHASKLDQVAFYESWIKHFSKEKDLKVFAQQQLVDLYSKLGLEKKVQLLRNSMLRENRTKRFDLGIGVGAEMLAEKLDTKDWVEAEKEFKSLIRKFDDQGGGNLFYKLVRPYFFACLLSNEHKRAKSGLKYAFSKMNIEKGSILDLEIHRLFSVLEQESE